jgi:hypothetical protein
MANPSIWAETMKVDRFRRLVVLGVSLLSMAAALPALGQSHGGHGGGHGAAREGGGHGGGHRGGPGWWGLGLGLGLGWEGAYLAYPYSYPYLAYPYPNDYAYGQDPGYVPYAPAPVAPQAAPGAQGYAPGYAPAANWYYCESARSYYPYVAQCPEAWRLVPATPPGAAR